MLSSSLRQSVPALYQSSLIPLTFGPIPPAITEETTTTVPLQNVVAQHPVSLAFVIALAALQHLGTPLHIWGVVKETEADGEGVYEFYDKYFPFPLYRDEGLELYKALGNNKLGLKTWNPLRLFRGYRALTARLDKKKITGNLKGEGIVQGGILIFSNGELKFGFPEDTGEPLDMDELTAAIASLQPSKTEGTDEL